MNMTCEKQIAAPPDRVFKMMSDFANAPKRISGISKVEMLTDGNVGVGTKFKETRVMFGKEATETMEVRTFDPPRSYTLHAFSCGCDYLSTMRCVPNGKDTKVVFEFQSTPKSIFAKVFSPIMGLMMGGMLKKCVIKDLDDLKKAAEGAGSASA